jgi:hypothetical protein
MTVKLSILAICMGLLVALVNLVGLLAPAPVTAFARKFPRNTAIGYVLMAIGTIWFLYNVSIESLADFESMKKFLFGLFIAIALGTCIFVKDFLAVRGLAIVMLLLGKLMVDSARWVDSEWRLVMVVWAYVLILAGMWLTVSPWRLRDAIDFDTANPKRLRMFSTARLAFGVFVAILGFVVF